MRAQQGVEEALDIRTGIQAEQAAIGVDAIPTSLRSLGVGTTEGNFTADTRLARSTTTGSVAGDLFFETDTSWLFRWTGVAWAYVTGVYAATNTTRTSLTISTADNNALFYVTDTGKIWKVVAGAWVDESASLDLTTSLKIAGTKVVGAQGAAVPDATGGAVIDVEARAAINALLARDRAHGLIAP